MSVMSQPNRTLLIGLDAADLDFVTEHLNELPCLQALAPDGVQRLESTASSLTASVWPTFYTGTLPGEHGLYYPMQWNPEAMQFHRVPDERVHAEPFWYDLARRGVHVATIDVQMVWPGDPEGGFELVNWGSQSYQHTSSNRPALSREIHRRFGAHPMEPDVPVHKSERRKSRLCRRLIEGIGKRGQMARWVLEQTEWDLGVVVFTEMHRAGHYCSVSDESGDDPRLLTVYRAVDCEIAEFIARWGSEASIVVFSLHGMGPNKALVHFVPEIVGRFNRHFLGRDGSSRKRSSRTGGGPMRRLRERIPPHLQEAMALRVPERLRDWVTARVYAGGLDWSETPAFALPSGTEGSIRLNLAGREAQGMLSAGVEERRYLDGLERVLLGLKTDAGTPAVRELRRPQELYPGSNSSRLPDLTIDWESRDPTAALHSATLGEMRKGLQAGRGGNHRETGFFAACGERLDSVAYRPTHIVDLARFSSELLGVSQGLARVGS